MSPAPRDAAGPSRARLWALRALQIGLVALYGVLWAWFVPRLPARIGTHYDALGRPDGWGHPSAFFGMGAVMVGLMAAIGLAVPALVRALPPSAVNLPNRDYWLAPERRAAAFDWLEAELAWFGAVGLAFVDALHGIIAAEHLPGGSGTLPSGLFLPLLGGVLGAAVVLVARIHRRFRAP